MMTGKEDLGLSLSLSFPHSHHSLQLNLNPTSPNFSSSPSRLPLQKPSWNDTVSSPSGMASLHADPNSESFRADIRPFLRGIDVNRLPSTVDCEEEEEDRVSSPNSTISSVSGKRSKRESICTDEDDDTSRKKLRLSKDQSAVLEESFKENNSTLNPKQKLALAKKLGLRARQVEVWFQNRRARTKLKQTEVDYEFLKRCYDKLTEENRRLQKEVMELRALKHSPQFYMQMTPTTLTMCPSCKKVSVPPNASSSSSTVDPRSHHLAQTFHSPIPINPLAHGPFGALHP